MSSDVPTSRHQHPAGASPGRGGWLRSRMGVTLLGFLLIAGFFLITEHTAHVFGVLPYLLLLACPFLHLFGHHGHGSPGGRGGAPREDGQ